MLHGRYTIWWTDIEGKSRLVGLNDPDIADRVLGGLRRLGYPAELVEGEAV